MSEPSQLELNPSRLSSDSSLVRMDREIFQLKYYLRLSWAEKNLTFAYKVGPKYAGVHTAMRLLLWSEAIL